MQTLTSIYIHTNTYTPIHTPTQQSVWLYCTSGLIAETLIQRQLAKEQVQRRFMCCWALSLSRSWVKTHSQQMEEPVTQSKCRILLGRLSIELPLHGPTALCRLRSHSAPSFPSTSYPNIHSSSKLRADLLKLLSLFQSTALHNANHKDKLKLRNGKILSYFSCIMMCMSPQPWPG